MAVWVEPMPEQDTVSRQMPVGLGVQIKHALAALDLDALKHTYLMQDEFLVVERFLPAPVLDGLLETLSALRPIVHRNHIPRYRKGGSISRFKLNQLAPIYARLYSTPEFKEFLEYLRGAELLACPDKDPHAYALYFYAEPGDHIGYHFDTSYYRGQRYTVLLGLVDRSSCRLEYQLYRNDCGRPSVPVPRSCGPRRKRRWLNRRLSRLPAGLPHLPARALRLSRHASARPSVPVRRLTPALQNGACYRRSCHQCGPTHYGTTGWYGLMRVG